MPGTSTWTTKYKHICSYITCTSPSLIYCTYFPDFQPNSRWPSKRGITLQQLASHMSGIFIFLCLLLTLQGLPRNQPCKQPCNVTNEVIFERMQSMPLIYPPGSFPVYSNFGFNLLGHVLEHVLNGPQWKECIPPLSIAHSSFDTS